MQEGQVLRTELAAMADAGTAEARELPGWARLGFGVSVVIAVAVVVRRVVSLSRPAQQLGASGLENLDAAFSSHAALTLAHILPALAFVLLAPLAVWRKPRGAAWPAALLYPLGTIVGLTAYGMSRYAVGGWTERSAVLLFDSLFLFSLMRAFMAEQAGREEQQRRWLVRAIGILLGIATTRPVMALFFATRGLTHLSIEQFFGWAFWIGFSINLMMVEWWLRYGRERARP